MMRGSARIRIARLDGRLEAAAVFRVADVDARWQLDLLATRDGDDDRALDAALRRAVQDAGAAGTRRLFARMPTDVNDERALRRAGFVPYMTEHVLRFQGGADSVKHVSGTVRRAHPADVWSVYQLYLELVPRQVQYAEAVTSRAWDGLQPLRPGMKRASGWVLEERGHIRAFARISTREHAGVARLDVLSAPEIRHSAHSVIAAAMREARLLHGLPCVVVVPGYEGELIHILQDMDFVDAGTQTAFVCYTTLSSRAQAVAVDLRAQVELQPRPATVPGLGTAGASAARFQDRLVDSRTEAFSRSDGD